MNKFVIDESDLWIKDSARKDIIEDKTSSAIREAITKAAHQYGNSTNPHYPRDWGGTWVSDHVEFTNPDISCGTHEVGEIAQYPDGTIVGNCKQCGDRMTLTAVPGGYTPMQIRGFLERVIAGNAESDGELLAELGRLIAVMELEREELELATNRIEIAKTILTQRAEAKP